MTRPTGLSESQVIQTLATIEALAEISNVAPPQKQIILDEARARLEEKPDSPPGAPPPPTPPTP